jgi:hypothetical protein
MATYNTAFGSLPGTKEMLGTTNTTGGGQKQQQPQQRQQQPQQRQQQQGLAPGATPTFAQMQQQGQARPAPSGFPLAQQPLQQPPMLSALNTQLGQPAQQPQSPKPMRQFTPEELTSARTRFQELQKTGIANINTAAAQWGQGVAGSPMNIGGTVKSALENFGPGSSMGGGGFLTGGTYSVGADENNLPTATWTPTGGVPQIIRQDFPEELRAVLEAAQAEDLAAARAAAAAQPQQEPMGEQQQMTPASYGSAQQQIPAYQSSGEFVGSSQAQVLRARLEKQLNDLSQNEAQIQGQSYAALRKAKMDEMGAEFGAQRSQIEEDLARRGLSASTIGGGRFGDLAGQQARAVATFEAELLRQQAEAEAENRKVYLSGMSELAGMAGQQDLGAFEANLRSRQADADISLRTQELQQRAELEGRSLSLQEARDLATKEYQGGQLQQGYAEISSRERMSASDIAARQAMQQSQFGFDREQSSLERGLREKMQTQQLTSEEQRQLRQIDATRALQNENLTAEERRQLTQIAANKDLQTDSQTFQGAQSALERSLREKMQTQQLTSEEQRQLRQIEANKLLQSENLTAEERRQLTQIAANKDLQADAQTFQGAQSALERSLREKMQTQQLTSEERRKLTQIEANKLLQADAQTFQGAQSQLERDLRKQLQEGQITAEGQRQLTQIEANKSLQEGQQKWQAGQTEKGNTFQAAQSQLDRDLRKQLSTDEIKMATDRFNKQFGLDEKRLGLEQDRFTADTAQNRNQFLSTLAATLAPLSQKQRDQILADLGIKKPPTGATSPDAGQEIFGLGQG